MLRQQYFVTLLLCVSSLLIGFLAAPGAHAQAEDRADDLFIQGKAAAQAKDWEQAHQLLSEAWQLKKSYDIASNLGQVAYLLGKHAEAAQHVAYALRHYPATGDAEQKQKTQSLLDLVRQEVSSLALNVSHGEAEILIDGSSAGRAAALPPELFVEPGERTIVARLGGERALRELTAKPGHHYRLDLVLSSPKAAAASSAPDESFQDSSAIAPRPSEPGIEDRAPPEGRSALAPKHIALIVGGGLTLASGVGLAIYTVKRAEAESDVDVARHRVEAGSGGSSSCAQSQTQSCRDLGQAVDDWESAGRGRNVFLGTTIGLGAATLATYLLATYWLWPDSSENNGSPTAHSSPTVTPILSADQQGLLLSGSF
jgi:hypothetical protein